MKEIRMNFLYFIKKENFIKPGEIFMIYSIMKRIYQILLFPLTFKIGFMIGNLKVIYSKTDKKLIGHGAYGGRILKDKSTNGLQIVLNNCFLDYHIFAHRLEFSIFKHFPLLVLCGGGFTVKVSGENAEYYLILIDEPGMEITSKQDKSIFEWDWDLMCKLYGPEKVFILAHEIGHAVQDHCSKNKITYKDEIEADEIALNLMGLSNFKKINCEKLANEMSWSMKKNAISLFGGTKIKLTNFDSYIIDKLVLLGIKHRILPLQKQ